MRTEFRDVSAPEMCIEKRCMRALSTTLKRVWVRHHIMTMICRVIGYGMIKSHLICGDRRSVAWARFVYEVKLRSGQYDRLGSYSVLVYSIGLWVLLRNDLCGRTSSYLHLSLYGDLEACFRAGGAAEQCLYWWFYATSVHSWRR